MEEFEMMAATAKGFGPASVVTKNVFRFVAKPLITSIARAFAPGAISEVLDRDLIVFKQPGGKDTNELNFRWYGLEPLSADTAQRSWSLPTAKTAEFLSVHKIPADTPVIFAEVADMTGVEGFVPNDTGGGQQVYVLAPSNIELIGKTSVK